MQHEEAQKLRKQWGDKPCTSEHHYNSLEKEHYLSSHTGDYVCPVCGRCFSENDLKRMQDAK